jgi:polyhydroxyalkanoate synthesis regulator phasin
MNTPETHQFKCPNYEKCKAVSNLYALGEMVSRDQEYLAKRLDIINQAEERAAKRKDREASQDLDYAEKLFDEVAEGELTHEEAEEVLEDFDEFKRQIAAEFGAIGEAAISELYEMQAGSGIFSKKQLKDLDDRDLSPEERRNGQITKLDQAIGLSERISTIAEEHIPNCPEEASGLRLAFQGLRETFLPGTTVNSVHFLHVCPNRELIHAMKALRNEAWTKENADVAGFWLPHKLD